MIKTNKVKTELTREEFMKETKIFVTHDYYKTFCLDTLNNYLNDGLCVKEAIEKWKEENECGITPIALNEKFQFLFDDTDIWSDSVERENPEEMTGKEVINCLSQVIGKLKDKRENNKEVAINMEKLIKVVELQMGACDLLINNFADEIRKDNKLHTRISLYMNDINSTLNDNKELLLEEGNIDTKFIPSDRRTAKYEIY